MPRLRNIARQYSTVAWPAGPASRRYGFPNPLRCEINFRIPPSCDHLQDVKVPVADAVRLLVEYGTGTVMVSESGLAGGHIIRGIISEKDYIQKLSHGSFPPHHVTAAQIMHPFMDPAQPNTRVVTVAKALLAEGRRHCPVLTDSAVIQFGSSSAMPADVPVSAVQAVVSMRDIVGFITENIFEQQTRAGETEETLKQGKKRPDILPPEQVTTGSGTASSSAAPSSSAPASQLPHVGWDGRADDLLSTMKAAGSRILLNALIKDSVTVADAANRMAEVGMSCVAIVDDEGKLQGVFTSRDFFTRVLVPGQNAAKVLVKDVMTREVVSAAPDRSILRCARAMLKRGFRHLPVCESDGKVIGMLSMADIARCLVGNGVAGASAAQVGQQRPLQVSSTGSAFRKVLPVG